MLKGVYTAIVTPFNLDGSVDEQGLRDLVEKQVKAKVTGILPCGTTGESPTLSHSEHNRVIEIVTEQVNGRCEVMAGTGSNSTDEAIMMTRHAKEVGVTSSLQVAPYYNKPTQKGLYEHFKAIANAVDIPIILYNIKGRTGINIDTATVAELAKIKNIVAVKEASGSMDQMMEVIGATPADFSVFSGDDNLTLPLMAAGGQGVISVASNIIPEKIVKFVNLGLQNDFIKMREMYYQELEEIFKKLFIETNPIPVKKILALKNIIKSVFRLPLCEPSTDTIAVLEKLIKKYQI